MTSIVTTTQVQKNIGKISQSIGDDAFIVTSHGKGKIVMLPYFDGCDENVSEYIEDYEMFQNHEVLQKRYKESAESGKSSLVI
jgi:hypothetical protein